ncbi:MAG: ATP-binding protein [Armatimonadetes bacterium]|nr:ATP-binding protein [Armatimonadota bacterium]
MNTRELDRFAQLLAEPADAPRIVYVHGPPGVGKSSLLGKFARACVEAGIKPVETDLLNAQWQRPSRLRATILSAAQRLNATKSQVWILDSCELFGAHFDWFWRYVVPGLSAGILLVVASCRRPADTLAADPGWQGALTILPLGELRSTDAAALLAARSVSPAAQASTLSAAGGFPFALSYLAGQFWFTSEARPRMEWHDALAGTGRGLLGEETERVPGSAMIAAALLRRTTEGAIAAVAAAEPDDEPRMGVRELLHASAAFDAIADLPYVASDAGGLSMPAAHREVILSNLRRRDEDRYRRTWRHARAWTLSRILASDEPDVESALDHLFSLRHGALTAARPPAVADTSCAAIDLARGNAWSVVGAVAEKEGPHEAEAIARWLGADGARVMAARGARGFEAYLITVSLAKAYALETLDPVADQIVFHERIRAAHVRGAPLSNGQEGGWAVRVLGVCDREARAIGSPALPPLATTGRAWTTAFVLRHFLATSRLAASYLAARAADLVPPPARASRESPRSRARCWNRARSG